MLRTCVAAVALLAGSACTNAAPSRSPYDVSALPPGPLGKSIRYGHDIITDTRRLMKAYIGVDMDCAACHIDAGTKPRGGSFVGTYARFPQWNNRARRVITLQDRVAECFLYSMNGRPPAYSGREMVALVAYIAWLSRGVSVGASPLRSDGFIGPLPDRVPNVARGARTYAFRCVVCHQADGRGIPGTVPPLWGKRSFNDRAGMAHIDRMTGFVRFNMPQNTPGLLSLEEAYDVAAFVLAHRRPHFQAHAVIASPPVPARYF
ncbi:MAG: c-type cytochrome [Candidatus Eremiobacteraeota bacterium]|nr:c-type cytochrome [Candidatus Eremiobacteraeota bacterium]MBV8375245.1 c-type cytochrome [Candidatus Eremiobacteraeota bacterium]